MVALAFYEVNFTDVLTARKRIICLMPMGSKHVKPQPEQRHTVFFTLNSLRAAERAEFLSHLFRNTEDSYFTILPFEQMRTFSMNAK